MLISLVIPCYQERGFIAGCLDSVQAFEVPSGATLEILVIDGQSTDGTREILSDYAARDPRIRLIENPARIQSTALNLGIRAAQGTYLVRLDVHSLYPPNYLRVCIETAIRTGADNVGGLATTLPRGTGYQAALVQALTTHWFGVGDSGFRTGVPEGTTDTVPYGCFHTEIFRKVGFFDERLVRAQDYEMNRRIAAAGGTIWLTPQARVLYYQQPDLQSFFRKQIEKEAPYNAYLWYCAPYAFTPRHAVTGGFAAGILGGLALSALSLPIRTIFIGVLVLYAALALLASVQQARRYSKPAHIFALPFCFFGYHFLHGLGVLYGLSRLATQTAPVQAVREPWSGAGRARAWPISEISSAIPS